jgi:hypothetical protein
MHRKRQISLALRGQHPGWSKARVVDEQWAGIPFLLDRVRQVGNDRFKRLVVPAGWINQSVSVRDIEMLIVDVVQKHVNPAQVVGRQVNLLSEEALSNLVLTK